MKLLFPAILGALLLAPATVRADDAPAAKGCGLASGIMNGPGQVMINCVGVSEEFAGQLAGILTYVLQRRLDPEVVIAKLDEIQGMPVNGEARTVSAEQGQTIVNALAGQPAAQIKIVASPAGKDAGDYALAIATKLQTAGWQIAGGQIPRVAPPGIGEINGIALVVRDEKAPPDMALRLKQAFAAAKIFLPIVSDGTMAADTALLWIGKQPELSATQQ
jgi:hypothetical protein